MSILLDKLIDKNCNVYEMTCVAIQEATLLSEKAGDTEIENSGKKVVSLALEKVLDDEVEFTGGDEAK